VSTDPISAVEPTRVTVVESEACSFCQDAHRVLDELATCYPLTVDTLSVRSAAGQDLMARHRAALSPLVLLVGVYFSHGRLPRRRLRTALLVCYGQPTDQVREGSAEPWATS